ncbi:MAG: N,N'-diacetylchitobiose phosphorylase [Kiritimatiellae bacterium]|nr:N,N'-diacetylchitobiose phosphorylase [Kiritimatiellia bacterium]
MQYGYFDDERREYVITRPDTPRSWSNYLGSTRYGAIVTNNAGGYSFYQSTARGRLTRLTFNSVPMDQPGRYIYLRDADSGDYWSGSWQPVGKPLDQFTSTCRHGTGYTTITSQYDEIESEATYFVPLDQAYECWALKVTNQSDRPRKLDLFSYAEFTNDWNVKQDTINLQYTQYTVDCAFSGRCITRGSNVHLEDSSMDPLDAGGARYTFMGLMGADVTGFDTDREAFLGPYRTYANPLMVEAGRCGDSTAHGDNACGALQTQLTLEPGESRELVVVFGIGDGASVGEGVLDELGNMSRVHAELEAVKQYWHNKLGNIMTKTPDGAVNSMVNVWNAYNALITFAWSRAASLVYAGERDGLGYRDTVQDLLGVIPLITEDAGERLELMITGQCSNGGAMPVVKPFEHNPGHEPLVSEDEYRADDCLWLFNTVPAYVKETGDISFLQKVLPYADKGEGTVLNHLRRALEFNLARRGTHGLPCGLAADWNDCLVLGSKGESMFVAFQLRFGLNVYHEICEMMGEAGEAQWANTQLREIDGAIQSSAWDGEWFVRGFPEGGGVLGSRENEEGSLYLNAQSWAVISGVASHEQALSAMDHVHDRLATAFGIALCDPPYAKTPVAEVRSGLFNPSMKENGGIFCHPQSWGVIAETMLGRGNRAYEYLRAFLPAAFNDRAEIREIEPYVHAQSVHGKQSRRFGAARLPWLSGTVSWTYYTMTHHVLGIRPDWDGLRIDPCIPADWDGFSVTRHFRGATYHITVTNPDGVEKGVAELTVSGMALNPREPIPPANIGEEMNVEVVMGKVISSLAVSTGSALATSTV